MEQQKFSPNSPKKRYLIKIWYIGTEFSGSQRQINAERTIENEIIRALKILLHFTSEDDIDFKATTRTDMGVHALESAIAFTTDKVFYPRQFDTSLPDDIGVVGWAEVPLDFNPRFQVLWKEYEYFWPLIKNSNLNIDQMKKALKMLEGTHNMRLLSKNDASKEWRSLDSTIINAELYKDPEGLKFIFRGTYFLWEQIRRMVTFVIRIGMGEKSLDDLENCFRPEYLNDPHMHKEKPSPPDGLILTMMQFDEKIRFETHPKCQQRMKKVIMKKLIMRRQQSYSLNRFFEKINY